MTGEGGEPANTDGLQYPMVDLFTGGMIMPGAYECCGDVLPVMAYCTDGVHGRVEECA